MRHLLLIGLLLLAAGCQQYQKPAAAQGDVPRIEFKRAVRRIETFRTDQMDLSGTKTKVQDALVLDAYIYDPGAQEVRHGLVAKAIPKVMAALGAGSQEPFVVRLHVVPGDDRECGWNVSLYPRQVRAMMPLSEVERSRALRQLVWGYTERRDL